jgi:hypothetical protein
MGLWKPGFYYGIFHSPDLDSDFNCKYLRFPDWMHWFDFGLFHLPDLDTLILTIDFGDWNGAYGGCNRSAEDSYSSGAQDPASGISRGSYLPHTQILTSYMSYEIDDYFMNSKMAQVEYFEFEVTTDMNCDWNKCAH